MDIEHTYTIATNSEEAFTSVESFLTPENLKEFNVNATITKDKPNSMSAKGKGFTVDFNFFENKLEGKVTLSFLLKPFKGKILHILEKNLKKLV